MKQASLTKILSVLLKKLKKTHSYALDGFHPDFFLSLYDACDIPILLVLPDRIFDNASKYLHALQSNDLVVFVPPNVCKTKGPQGFLAPQYKQIQRSKAILSSGLGAVSMIVCSESGRLIPIVGTGHSKELDFSSDIDFNECIDFLSSNKYKNVETVVDSGDFSIRGGIIDVFPFSAINPVRLNFLDDYVNVHSFDVQTQLTIRPVGNFSIFSTQKHDLLSLKDSSLSNFITLFYNSTKVLNKNTAYSIGFSDVITQITFKDFSKKRGVDSEYIHIDNNLTSMGIENKNGTFIVPPWFVNKRPIGLTPLESSPKKSLNIANIKKGDYLVHRDHGVGICMGLLINQEENGYVQELLSIKYEDGGIIRLDANHIDLIDFFASSDSEGVILDSLQKKGSWSRKRNLAFRHAEETIEHLLNLYVRRNDISRSPFLPYNDMENKFLKDFPFHDTEDQVSAWKDISNDLSSSTPMDRLLCGDVGFGKTEIALRAAFRVVLGNKRVLILAPTTILVNQLYSSFHARLSPHAVNVEVVSRFRSVKKNKMVQENILLKRNDILVGTHSLLNNDIYMKNIGLLIIDEEHRFGVKQKEKIKCYKENVDVLSMSATPIPRSLNLALSGIYSISLLQTPPLMRLPIITHVHYFNEQTIQRAILFEVERGGQVYFVHNKIKSIEHITDKLQTLLPDLRIMFIHGQEPPYDVERKMELFVSDNIHVLVCTSIIEAGIDIPNVNCIIINNAHLFGLSQLYQIRGRVGRSHRQAYAYLIIPDGINLSDNAYNRMKTIEENVSLGSGYNISKSDMELRGSGSLFGYKQSGGINSVGYDMYLRLIQKVLHETGRLNSNFKILPENVIIEIYGQRYIPEEYIPIESLRLSFYKNLASACDDKSIDNAVYNFSNRFGPIPQSVMNLISEYRLRLLAAEAGIISIQKKGCGIVFILAPNNNKNYIAITLNYIDNFFSTIDCDFHILPHSNEYLSLCVHIPISEDKYIIISQFLNKFIALN